MDKQASPEVMLIQTHVNMSLVNIVSISDIPLK